MTSRTKQFGFFMGVSTTLSWPGYPHYTVVAAIPHAEFRIVHETPSESKNTVF